jgi:hypothetical protein
VQNTVNDSLWYIDSGANIHVCKDLVLIEEYQPIGRQIQVAGPYRTSSLGIGRVTLQMALPDGQIGLELILPVYSLPDSPANLISVSLLAKQSIYWDSGTHVLRRYGNVVGHTPQNANRLYPLSLYRPLLTTAFMTALTKLPLSVWHQRLGHLGFPKLRSYLNKLGITWLDDGTEHCRACALSKAKKVYKKYTNRRADQPFHTIFTDLVGPITPDGFQREKYYIVFIDDYSRYQQTYTVRTKSEWLDCFKEYYQWVENQFDTTIRILRTDYDSVIRSKAFESFLIDKGIQFEPAPADGQDMNGVAEAGQRTLTTMARTMAIGGDVPDYLWPDLVMAATYIKNRRPTAALGGKTPFEYIFKKAPVIDHLRVIGSRVYVLIQDSTKIQSQKLAPRAREAVLIGYDGDSICRVWIPETQRIERTKDHAIYEDTLLEKEASNIDETTLEQSALVPQIRPTQPLVPPMPQPNPKTSSKALRKAKRNNYHDVEPVPNRWSVSEVQRPPHMDYKSKYGRQSRRIDLSVDHTAYEADLIGIHAKVFAASVLASVEKAPCHYPDQIDPFVMLAGFLRRVQAADVRDLSALTTCENEATEPDTYHQAVNGPLSDQWLEAMRDEINSLIQNDTWVTINQSDLPHGKQVLSGKWVYKLKRDDDGVIQRYKARWVVKGFMQQYGLDFDETFASVVKPMAFRALFALAAFLDLEIEQMDVKTAFLYGQIDKEIYVRLPTGFTEGDRVCRLKKALYGLKQAPRLWFQTLTDFLLQRLGLHHLHADHSIFVSNDGLKGPIVTSWVDDLKIIAPTLLIAQRVKNELSAAFKMTDLGAISYYLGMKVTRNREERTLALRQKGYITKIVARFHEENSSPPKTPMEEKNDLVSSTETATDTQRKEYQSIVGSLMFAMVGTRPDIAYAISVLSRFAANPSKDHISAARRVLRYLNGSLDRGINYGNSVFDNDLTHLGITCYTDADWGGCLETRRSTSGYVCMINGGPSSWCSKRQTTVSTSTCEAEFKAGTPAAKEVTWMRTLLWELGVLQEDAQMTIFTDSQSAQALAENPVHHNRSKHIDIQYHYLREETTSGRIKLEYINTKDMIADGLTKPLGPIAFSNFLSQINIL